MWDAPIVEEIHQIRCQIAAECQHDINAIYAAALHIQQSCAQQLITQVVKREETTEKQSEKLSSKSSGKTKHKRKNRRGIRQKMLS